VNPPVSAQITQRSGSNLAIAFILLPPRKRAAMLSLYAFCREVDDVADDEAVPAEQRALALAEWRRQTRAACEGQPVQLPVLQELKPFIPEFSLPFSLFDALIQGVEMDLHLTRYPDFPTLEKYCYHVASVVGLLSIQIFGYQDPACRAYADALGKALQLTNILRDVGEDARRGRIYLPATELDRFGVPADDLLAGRDSDRFQALAREMAGRARGFYREARRLLPAAERSNMIAAELMGAVYWKLLRELERRRFPVLGTERVRLSSARKLCLIVAAALRIKTGLPLATYGE
jgi:phytoene synthase